MGHEGRRKQAYGFGLSAESYARAFLRLKGYRILDQRLKGQRGSRHGEIDVIARRGRTLVFAEVKARQSLAHAREAISPRQQDRIRAAADAIIARVNYQNPRPLNGRFDAILVTPGRFGLPRLKHIQNAW